MEQAAITNVLRMHPRGFYIGSKFSRYIGYEADRAKPVQTFVPETL